MYQSHFSQKNSHLEFCTLGDKQCIYLRIYDAISMAVWLLAFVLGASQVTNNPDVFTLLEVKFMTLVSSPEVLLVNLTQNPPMHTGGSLIFTW